MESHEGQYEDYDAWRVSHKLSTTQWGISMLVGAVLTVVTTTLAGTLVAALYTFYSVHMALAIAGTGHNRALFEWYRWGGYTPIYNKRPTGPEYETAASKLDYGESKRV